MSIASIFRALRVSVGALHAFASTPAIRPTTSAVLASAASGTTIVTLADPFAGQGLGTTTWTTFGTLPGQFQLVGNTIVTTSTAMAAGTSYSVSVLATSGDGMNIVGDTIQINAAAGTGQVTAASLNSVKTTSGLSSAMATQTLSAFAAGTPVGTQITVDPTTTYQSFLGVGASLTGSSAYCLMNYLTAAQRTAILTEMFGTNGYSMIRITIGSSDFSATGDYTYDETANDTALTNFALSSADTGAIIPILQQILTINPNVKIIAAPWTPPTWMKTGANSSNAFIGGTFNATTSNLTTYAQYFVKYINAMAGYNIPIYAVSAQNEPTNTTNRPSCGWATADMLNFVKNYLKPAFSTASISTFVWAGDDSWNVYSGAGTNVSLLASGNGFDGYAWHGYGGQPTQMTTTHTSYPSQPQHFTEHRTLLSQSVDAQIAQVAGLDIISVLRNWASSITFWNMALDQTGAPATVSTGRQGVLTIKNDSSGTITRNTEYYALAHIAKYVQRGAVRIASTSPTTGASGTDIETVAFKNPDNSIVVFFWNGSSSDIPMSIVDASSSKFTSVTATARAMQTVVYSGVVGTVEALAVSGVPAANASLGIAYDYLPTTTGGTKPYTYALTGTLPAGMAFNTSTGEITGSPTATGTATGLRISVTDSSASPATVQTAAFSISVVANLTITNSPASTATVGTAYSYTPAVTGGTGTYSSYALNVALGSGLAFDPATGIISGTPTAAASFANMTITVTDSAGNTYTTPFFGITIATAPALTITGTPATTATIGTSYSFTPTVSGGTSPYTFALTGTLPAGLSFSTTTGAITGSPTTAQSVTGLKITATDAANATASLATFGITVSALANHVSTDAFASSYPSTASASPLTTTWTHTVASNANLIVVAIAAGTPYKSGSDLTWTSTVTIGGVAATNLSSTSAHGSPGGHDRMIELWSLTNPPTGAQSVVATITSTATGASTSNIAGVSRSYINAAGVGTAVTTANASGSVTSSTVTTTGGSANGLVFQAATARSTAAPTAGTGQTVVSGGISGTNMALNTSEAADGGGSVVTSFTIATADQFASAAVPILSA